ncbi:MAG: cell cycle transcriptional regulator TrcR, partial [bacterium]
MYEILMPKATAVWLIDNTGLTFDQIAAFCGLHPLEVKGIADGDVATGVRGLDPIANSQLSREEIARGEADPTHKIKPLEGRKLDLPPVKKRGGRYTPVSRRQDRPDAIAWFLSYHPEITDAQLGKLIGTTKSTIESVRSRSHWN